MQINFIPSKDSGETRTMHTKSCNIEIMMGSETNDIIEELHESLLQNYQEGEESMMGSSFVRDSIDLLYYHLQKISLKRARSYIDSLKQLKNKRATIIPKNNDNNCFQYALTVALNYQNIKKVLQKISKFKPFIDQYNWKEIDFPSHSKDWKKSEQNNKTVVVNTLFVLHNTEEIRLAYKFTHSLKSGNQVIVLMITDGKNWHQLAVTRVPALLRGITSNHNGDFYCLNCSQSYSTKNKLKEHERV